MGGRDGDSVTLATYSRELAASRRLFNREVRTLLREYMRQGCKADWPAYHAAHSALWEAHAERERLLVAAFFNL